MKESATNSHRVKSGYERYEEMLQEKKPNKASNEHIIVPAAIKVTAWIALIAGLFLMLSGFNDGTWIYGTESAVASIFLFGFSAIVKAAYKYLSE